MAAVGLPLAHARGTGRGAAAAVSPDRASLLTPAEAEAVAGEWSALAARAAEDNPFFVPDVALPAARHFGEGVQIAMVRDGDGRLIAAAPITHTRLGRIAPAVRVWSHDYGPLGMPLIDRADLDGAATGFVEGLAAGGSLVVPDMPLGGPVAEALRRAAARAGRLVAVLDAHERAALDTDEAGNDLRAALPARRRKEYGRQMRRLADDGKVGMDAATEPQAVGAAFDEFLALEAAGWKGKGGTSLSANRDKADFAREALARRAAEGAARIDALRLNGRAIAMVVSFIAGRTAVTWKMAYDEAFARFSPGAQIMLDLPQAIFADKRVTRIDSLAAAHHPMIDHLWKGRLAIGTLVIGPPGNGVLHRLGLGAARAEMRARVLAKRLLRRG